MFIHIERLLDQGWYCIVFNHPCMIIFHLNISEINKVRIHLFNLNARPKMELPEPNGEKKIFQERVFIPVQQHPEVSLDQAMLSNIMGMVQLLLFRFLRQ